MSWCANLEATGDGDSEWVEHNFNVTVVELWRLYRPHRGGAGGANAEVAGVAAAFTQADRVQTKATLQPQPLCAAPWPT